MDDEAEPDRMVPGDYTLTPSGALGSRVSVGVIEGSFVGEYDTADEALEVVRCRTEKQQFWPSIWWVSDHGNYWAIDLDGNEIKELVT